MVNAANIFDEESLRAWLKEQVNFISLQVASRSMLRLLPIWTAYTATEDARNRGVESLPVLRAFLATQIVPAYTSVHSATLLAAVAPNVRRITANLDNIFSVKNIAAMENLYGPGDHLETVASVSIVVLSAYAVGGRERELQVAHLHADDLADIVRGERCARRSEGRRTACNRSRCSDFNRVALYAKPFRIRTLNRPSALTNPAAVA